ncbi:MAG: hypothetical protein B6D64_10565 [Bacteroidetes bacterium 4484_276]|nr:MAG: hypothetical protein B6D64_10565 [Bacteroidetes bacterium 4484_276]
MEKNKKILDNALGRLGSFTPKDRVWNGIDNQLHQEVLTDSLSKLKSFDPPNNTWGSITNELSKKEKLSQLRKFAPGAINWEKIEDGLNIADRKSFKTKIIRFATLATAAAALIIFTYFILFPVSNKTNISYSAELMVIEDTNQWQDDDDEIMDVLDELCASNPIACSAPDYRAKEKELTYLNERKTEILNRMNVYDENVHLQVILTRLELEKTEIVKQMISKILDRS